MEELTNFDIFIKNILYFIGWIISQMRYLFIGFSGINGFDSPLIWLTFGLFFAFATLHIFKRILRKG